jgi:hypothetical protein
LQRVAAWISVLSMGGLIAVMISRDVRTLQSTTFSERISAHSLTSVELAIAWSAVGVGLYALARLMKKKSANAIK